MNAKEKALELVNKYIAILQENYGTAVAMVLAKECAIIAVDEMLNIDCKDISEEYFNEHIEYLENVKQEIKKL